MAGDSEATDRTVGLESKDLTIPLSGEAESLEAIADIVNPLIDVHLRRAAREGWQPDGPTDVIALWQMGRLNCREHTSFWSDRRTYSLRSVSIRLHRFTTARKSVGNRPQALHESGLDRSKGREAGDNLGAHNSESETAGLHTSEGRPGVATTPESEAQSGSRTRSMTTVEQLLDAKGSDVWSVPPDGSVFDAIKLMAEKEVGALPVVEGDRLVGIISERDYARKVILKGRSSKTTPVQEIMTDTVFSVQPRQTVEECMELMTEKHIRHLPVVRDGQLVGIISIGDLVKSIISNKEAWIQQLESYITGH